MCNFDPFFSRGGGGVHLNTIKSGTKTRKMGRGLFFCFLKKEVQNFPKKETTKFRNKNIY